MSVREESRIFRESLARLREISRREKLMNEFVKLMEGFVSDGMNHVDASKKAFQIINKG